LCRCTDGELRVTNTCVCGVDFASSSFTKFHQRQLGPPLQVVLAPYSLSFDLQQRTAKTLKDKNRAIKKQMESTAPV